jgi:hypothetical protein
VFISLVSLLGDVGESPSGIVSANPLTITRRVLTLHLSLSFFQPGTASFRILPYRHRNSPGISGRPSACDKAPEASSQSHKMV